MATHTAPAQEAQRGTATSLLRAHTSRNFNEGSSRAGTLQRLPAQTYNGRSRRWDSGESMSHRELNNGSRGNSVNAVRPYYDPPVWLPRQPGEKEKSLSGRFKQGGSMREGRSARYREKSARHMEEREKDLEASEGRSWRGREARMSMIVGIRKDSTSVFLDNDLDEHAMANRLLTLLGYVQNGLVAPGTPKDKSKPKKSSNPVTRALTPKRTDILKELCIVLSKVPSLPRSGFDLDGCCAVLIQVLVIESTPSPFKLFGKSFSSKNLTSVAGEQRLFGKSLSSKTIRNGAGEQRPKKDNREASLSLQALGLLLEMSPVAVGTAIASKHGIPVLCELLHNADSVNDAIFALQALELISRTHAKDLLFKHALGPLLADLQSFPSDSQRVAAAAAANICWQLGCEPNPISCYDIVRPALPNLREGLLRASAIPTPTGGQSNDTATATWRAFLVCHLGLLQCTKEPSTQSQRQKREAWTDEVLCEPVHKCLLKFLRGAAVSANALFPDLTSDHPDKDDWDGPKPNPRSQRTVLPDLVKRRRQSLVSELSHETGSLALVLAIFSAGVRNSTSLMKAMMESDITALLACLLRLNLVEEKKFGAFSVAASLPCVAFHQIIGFLNVLLPPLDCFKRLLPLAQGAAQDLRYKKLVLPAKELDTTPPLRPWIAYSKSEEDRPLRPLLHGFTCFRSIPSHEQRSHLPCYNAAPNKHLRKLLKGNGISLRHAQNLLPELVAHLTPNLSLTEIHADSCALLLNFVTRLIGQVRPSDVAALVSPKDLALNLERCLSLARFDTLDHHVLLQGVILVDTVLRRLGAPFRSALFRCGLADMLWRLARIQSTLTLEVSGFTPPTLKRQHSASDAPVPRGRTTHPESSSRSRTGSASSRERDMRNIFVASMAAQVLVDEHFLLQWSSKRTPQAQLMAFNPDREFMLMSQDPTFLEAQNLVSKLSRIADHLRDFQASRIYDDLTRFTLSNRTTSTQALQGLADALLSSEGITPHELGRSGLVQGLSEFLYGEGDPVQVAPRARSLLLILACKHIYETEDHVKVWTQVSPFALLMELLQALFSELSNLKLRKFRVHNEKAQTSSEKTVIEKRPSFKRTLSFSADKSSSTNKFEPWERDKVDAYISASKNMNGIPEVHLENGTWCRSLIMPFQIKLCQLPRTEDEIESPQKIPRIKTLLVLVEPLVTLKTLQRYIRFKLTQAENEQPHMTKSKSYRALINGTHSTTVARKQMKSTKAETESGDNHTVNVEATESEDNQLKHHTEDQGCGVRLRLRLVRLVSKLSCSKKRCLRYMCFLKTGPISQSQRSRVHADQAPLSRRDKKSSVNTIQRSESLLHQRSETLGENTFRGKQLPKTGQRDDVPKKQWLSPIQWPSSENLRSQEFSSSQILSAVPDENQLCSSQIHFRMGSFNMNIDPETTLLKCLMDYHDQLLAEQSAGRRMDSDSQTNFLRKQPTTSLWQTTYTFTFYVNTHRQSEPSCFRPTTSFRKAWGAESAAGVYSNPSAGLTASYQDEAYGVCERITEMLDVKSGGRKITKPTAQSVLRLINTLHTLHLDGWQLLRGSERKQLVAAAARQRSFTDINGYLNLCSKEMDFKEISPMLSRSEGLLKPKNLHNITVQNSFLSQFGDVLAVMGGLLPTWVYMMVEEVPYLLTIACRKRFFRCTALDPIDALLALQEWAENGNTQLGIVGERKIVKTCVQAKVSCQNILEAAINIMEQHSSVNSTLEVEFECSCGAGMATTMDFYTLCAHSLLKPGLEIWMQDKPCKSALNAVSHILPVNWSNPSSPSDQETLESASPVPTARTRAPNSEKKKSRFGTLCSIELEHAATEPARFWLGPHSQELVEEEKDEKSVSMLHMPSSEDWKRSAKEEFHPFAHNGQYGTTWTEKLVSGENTIPEKKEGDLEAPVENKGNSAPIHVLEAQCISCPNGLFPSPISPEETPGREAHSLTVCRYFRFLGMLIAKALVDNRILPLPLSQAMLKLCRGERLSAWDLWEVDPSLAEHLHRLTAVATEAQIIDKDTTIILEERRALKDDLQLDGVKIKDLCLNFTVPGFPAIELFPGGTSVAVTIFNLSDYIKRVAWMLLETGIKDQVNALLEGIDKVFKHSQLNAFTLTELEAMVCGQIERWTVEYLKEVTLYNSDSGTVIITNFFEVLSEFDADWRRLFVLFLTGAPHLPAGGLQQLQPRLTLVVQDANATFEDSGSLQDLPTVSTCTHSLKLPNYSTKELLKEKLEQALSDGQAYFHIF